MRKTTALLLVVLAYYAGKLVQTWRFLRMLIDEYHTYRMDVNNRLDRVHDGIDDAEGRR